MWLNFVDIQLVVKRQKRPQVQTVVLTASLLKRYKKKHNLNLKS